MSGESKERWCDKKRSLFWYTEQILGGGGGGGGGAVVRTNVAGYVRCSTYNSKFNFLPNRKCTIFHTV